MSSAVKIIVIFRTQNTITNNSIVANILSVTKNNPIEKYDIASQRYLMAGIAIKCLIFGGLCFKQKGIKMENNKIKQCSRLFRCIPICKDKSIDEQLNDFLASHPECQVDNIQMTNTSNVDYLFVVFNVIER